MFFALGFLVSGLLSLLVLPAFWRRALRLSRRRLEMQMPLSMAEIVAERDQLRAEFAAERRRIEKANETLNEARARDLSELGRRGAAVAALTSELTSLRASAQELRDEVAAVRRQAAEAEGAFAAAQKEVYDVTGLAERRGDSLTALERAHDQLSAVAESRRAEIAGLESQVEGLRVTLSDTELALARAQLQYEEKLSAADLYQRERDYARADLAASNAKRDALQQTIEDLSARLSAQEEGAREAQRAKARAAAELERNAQDLEAALRAQTDLRAAMERQAANARDEARRQAERLQAIRSERDALQGALKAARAEAESLRRAASKAASQAAGQSRSRAPANDEQDDLLLRQAIVDLGGEITRLAHALDRDGESAAPPAERMRDLQASAVASRAAEAAS